MTSEADSNVEKLVVYLVGKKKALIAGKSLAYEIAGACKSSNTDTWPGRSLCSSRSASWFTVGRWMYSGLGRKLLKT